MWMNTAITLLLPSIAMAFTPPSQERIRDAIGDLGGLPVLLQRAFTPDDSFDPIPKPGPNDWLAVHEEPGQTFDEFKASHPNRPNESRRVIYLQPLGKFAADRSPSVEKLRDFAALHVERNGNPQHARPAHLERILSGLGTL